EAHMTDIKTYSFENRDRGGIQAGEPVHEMWVRISLDLDFVIHDLEAVTDLSPFKICKEAAAGMKKLIGLQIGPGWRRRVHDLVGRTAGCTHLVELLGPLATTAYQTMHWALEERAERKPQRDKPAIIDTCHALASDSPIVKLEWPQFYTGGD
ncbi:MAG: DUF2889 domain-containing protein, partial [Gammaproteobacteria bacterium]|nr:DUF2889 domain-containing protein [Gammaproteobacteria bacterium]